MFIDRGVRPLRLRSKERKGSGSDEGLLDFRSFERSWYWNVAPTYKHLTPDGVKTAVDSMNLLVSSVSSVTRGHF